MAEWLKLKDIPEPEQAVSGTPIVEFHFDLDVSPYDIPDAVRAFRTDGNRARIEFQYIDGPERQIEAKVDRDVVVRIGRHSHRVFAIDFDLVMTGSFAVNLSEFKRNLDIAMGRIEQHHVATTTNRIQVNRVLNTHQQDLYRHFENLNGPKCVAT